MTEKEYFALPIDQPLSNSSAGSSASSASSTGVDKRGHKIGSGLHSARYDKQAASFQNYLSNKATYGSSSAWYDNALNKHGQKQQQINTLQQQLKNAQRFSGRTAPAHGMKELGLASANFALDDGGKSVEELEKALAQAQREFDVLSEDLANATQWKIYDADTAWFDSMEESGQSWGDISDLLGKGLSSVQEVYNKAMAELTKAQKQNKAIDDRRGRVPNEVSYSYTSEEDMARLQEKVDAARELMEITSRRYGLALDEVVKQGDDVRLGRVKAFAYGREAEEANREARTEYAENHVKGDTMGGVWNVLRTDKSNYLPGDNWTEDQLNRYYVIFQRQGEEAAGKFAAEVNTYNNLEAQQEATEGFYEWGSKRSLDNAEGFWGHLGAGIADTARGLAGTALSVAGMPGEMIEYLEKAQDVFATGTYTGGEAPAMFGVGLSDYGEAISQGRAETLNKLGTIGGKGLGDVYRLTGSMAQSLVYGNLAGSAGTLTLFFGSAANQGFDEAMSRGATGEQAMAFGMLSGIAEAAAEFVPLENLLSADKSLTRGFLKSALYQAGFEGLEEGETDVLNAIADQLVLKDKSAMNTAIRQRMEQGESYEQAAKAEWSGFVKDVVWDMLGGAVSGAGSSLIQYPINMASPYQANEQGQYAYGANARQLAAEAAAVQNNKTLSDLGKKVESKAAGGKAVSNFTAKRLAKGTNRAAMVDAVEKQLSERADKIHDKDERRIMANAIVSEARGEKPGPKGKRLMEKNKEISDAIISELDIKQPAAWAQQIGVRGVEGLAYGDRDDIKTYNKVKADAESIKADKSEAMYAEVTLPTEKGEVKGELVGLEVNKTRPSFIIQGKDRTLDYVPVDDAINSGALPDGVGRLAYEALGLGDIAAEAYKLYSPGQNTSEYITDLGAAIELAGDVSTREVFNKSESVRRLTKEQQAYAWNEGLQRRDKKAKAQQEAQTRAKGKKARKTPQVSFEGANVYGREYKATSRDKIKAADLRVIERMAEAANVDVVFYETDTDSAGDYIGDNGFYHDGTIYLDIHAGAKNSTQQDAILLTAAHELTHHIRQNAAKQYEALKKFVADHLLENGHDFEQMVQSRLSEPGMSHDDAVEEVVAKACEMVLRDSKAIEKLANENKSLAQTIADWLHGFYEDIKAAFEGVEARSKEAKAMEKYMDELVKLWDDALIEASKGKGQSGKVKQSIRADFYAEFDSWDKKDTNVTFTIGTTSEALKSVNIKNQEIKLRSGTVLNKIKKHGKEGIDFDTFRGIPELLEHPVLIQFSDAIDPKTQKHKYDDSITVIGDLYANGKPVMVALSLQPTNQKKTAVLDVVFIKSAYTKNALQNYINENTILYIDPNKKRTNTWLSLNRLQLPLGENQYGSVRRISYDKNGVKVQNSKNKTPMQLALEKAGAVDEYGKTNVEPKSKLAQIRYSRRDSSEGLTKEEARSQALAYTRLKAENAALQRRVEYWQSQARQSKQRTINQKDAEKYARELVKIHSSNVDPKWIKEQLVALGNYMLQTDSLDFDWMQRVAWKISTDLISNAEVEYETGYDADTKETITNSIKEARMHLDPMYKGELPEGFRKRYSGKLHISYEEGRGVDSVYQELQEQYGYELFPNMNTPADMLIMMAEAYDTMTAEPKTFNPYRSSMNETITSVSYDILDALLSGTIRETSPTMRDRAEQKIEAEKQNRRSSVKKLRDEKNARIEDIKRQEAAKRKEMRAKEKAKKWEKVDAVKTYYQDMIKRERAERNESAAAQRYRASVYKSINKLSNLLLKNSDKEHVPEGLKEPLLEFLTGLDVSSRRLLKKDEPTQNDVRYAERMQRLRDVLGRQRAYMKDPGNTEGLDVFLDLPNGFDEIMRQHIESMRRVLENHKMAEVEGPIAYMDSTQLQELDFILTVLTHSISEINEFHYKSRFKTVEEGAKSSIEYTRSLGTEIERSLARDAADKFLAWGNALPIYVFKRFGEAGSERFSALAKGWDQMAKNVRQIENTVAEIYEPEEVREWEETVHEIELSNGDKVKMTTAQIMGLYCSFKREQARRHLLAGGMRIGDIQTGKTRKTRIAQTDAVHLTHDDIITITKELSDRQINVANKLQEFMNTVCADWGNAISMARFGYRQFVEENYYPIVTDPNNLPATDPKARENDIFRLLNMAFTKQLNPNANNSIVINSIFDVFSAHAADMAKYNALALPVLDLMKWYNYKDTSHSDVEDSQGNVNRQLRAESVQSITERTYGRQAQEYIINFLKDLNGQHEGGRGEGMLRGLLGRSKSAAVAANLRVAIQQPTSVVRASYLLHPAYLARGAAMKGGAEEALKHSGLAMWKDMGYFDTNISRNMRQKIKHDESTADILREKSMGLAQLGDKATWGIIWNACKLEQQDKGLEGEELMKATTDRFNEVILSTQVIDSTISRSDIMRSPSLAVNEVTSFMSEPTVSYNILLDSVMKFETLRRQTGDLKAARREAWPGMGKAMLVYSTSVFATAAAAAIVDAMRDDDEYQNFIQKWLEHLGKNIKQGINPITLIPILNQLWGIVIDNENQESMIWQSFTQARKGVISAVDMARLMFDPEADVSEPNRTSWGRMYYVAQALSSLSGLPLASLMREIKTVWNLSGAHITGKRLKTYDSGVKNNIKYAVMDKYLDAEEAVALLVEAGEYIDADDAYWQVQEWINAEDSEWDRYNEVYAAVLAGDGKAYEMAVDTLGDHGIAAQSVRNTVKTQISRWFVGADGVTDTMDEKAALKALQDYAGMMPIEAQHFIDELKFEKKYGMKYSEMKDAYLSGTFNADEVKNFRKVYGHDKPASVAETLKAWNFEKETGMVYSQIDDAYIHGDISREQYRQYQKKYSDMSPAEIDAEILRLDAARDYGVKLGSTTAGIKAYVIEEVYDAETAKRIMMVYDGKTEEEADAYTNQYLFTKETGYDWKDGNGVMAAYAAGVIDDAEAKEWFKHGLINGSDESAAEYLQVAQWRRDIPGAESINREAIQKWNKYGSNIKKAGLGQEEFARAWDIYSSVSSQYDSEGHVVKEKKEFFFDALYEMYKAGEYSLKEIDGIARSIYASSTVNEYAPW